MLGLLLRSCGIDVALYVRCKVLQGELAAGKGKKKEQKSSSASCRRVEK